MRAAVLRLVANAIVCALTAAAAKFGLDVNGEMFVAIVSSLGTLLGVHAIAEVKGARKEVSPSTPPDPPPANPQPQPEPLPRASTEPPPSVPSPPSPVSPSLPLPSSGERADPTPTPRKKRMTFSSQVEFWRAPLTEQADGVPIDFLLAWLTIESGGNPCSTGFSGQQGSDGLFKFEAGIGQQFYESRTREGLNQTTVNGVSLATLRAPCSGQKATRALTDEEIRANVQAFMGDVQRFRRRAASQVAAAGVPWTEGMQDFWMLVKLQHGLPCVASSFLGPAANAGRADTFDNFAAFVRGLSREDYNRFTGAAGCRPAMDGFFGAPVSRVLDNAIRTGKGTGRELLGLGVIAGVLPAIALVLFAKFVMGAS